MVLDIEKIFRLFKSLYNGQDAEEFLPVVQLSAERTEKRLIAGINLSDRDFSFLHALAAADAGCRVLEIKAARAELALTRTGAVPQEADFTKRIEFARKYFLSCEELCSGLIQDNDFVFKRME